MKEECSRIISCLVLLALAGCHPPQDARVGELQKRVDEMNSQLVRIEADLVALKQATDIADMMRNIEGIAYLTPGSEGYSVVTFDLGKLAVSLEDIEPYANGSRVTLSLGNLTSATINDLNATLEWGSVNAAGLADNESAKSRNVTFQKPLAPASWTTVQTVLEGVPPQAFGFVRVKSVSHKAITLRTGGR